MAGERAKGGKKGRKIGRNKAYCKVYAAIGRETVNKRRKLRQHLRRSGEQDGVAMTAFLLCGGSLDYLRLIHSNHLHGARP